MDEDHLRIISRLWSFLCQNLTMIRDSNYPKSDLTLANSNFQSMSRVYAQSIDVRFSLCQKHN